MKTLVSTLAEVITEKEDKVFPYVGIGNVLDQNGLRSAIRTGVNRYAKENPEVTLQVNPTEKVLWLNFGGLTPVSVRLTKKQVQSLVQEFKIPTCS